jgi:hypothetical protein
MSKDSSSQYISVADVIKLVQELFAFFIAKFKLILLGAFLIGVLGITIAYISKPTFKGYLSFILNENEGGSLNLSSLAGLAGLGGSASGGGVNEDKLIFLAGSKFIIGNTLLSNIDIEGKKQLLINYMIDNYEMQKGFKSDTLLKDFTYFTNTTLDSLNAKENKVLDGIIKAFNEGEMLKIEGKKKTGIVAQSAGIITIDFKSQDEHLTKLFLDSLYANINKYYVNKVTQRQSRNYNLIKHRADSLKILLSSKEETGATFVDQNINLSKMTARVKVDRTKRDIEMFNLMYAEVLKNLEVAKFNLENQTPVLVLVDKPTYPLKIVKRSKILFGIGFGFLGGILTFIALYLKDYLKRNIIIIHS